MIGLIDQGVIALYFLGVLVIGFLASRQVKTSDDFSIAGGRLRFPVLMGTLIGTSIGAAATMGRAGKAAEVGVVILVSGVAYATGLLAFSFLAPTLKRIGIWSIPEALHQRYGLGFRVLAAGLLLVVIIGFFGLQLIAFGLVFTGLFPGLDISYGQAVIAAAIVMVLYTSLGGLLAVAYTDLLQAVIMIVAVGILLPALILSEVGGPIEALSRLEPPDGRWLGGLTVMYVVSFFLIDIPGALLDISLWQRTGAAQSVRHIQMATRWMALIFLLWSVVVVTLGALSPQLLPDLASHPLGSDAALPSLVVAYMPIFLRGLCLAAILAVLMSTADTVLLLAGTTMGWDICRVFRPDLSGERLVKIARLTIVVVGAMGTAFALVATGMFDIALMAYAIFASGLFVPTMAAIYWRRATKWAAIISTVAASSAVLLLYYTRLAGEPLLDIEPIIVGLVTSSVLMITISLITYNEKAATEPLVKRA